MGGSSKGKTGAEAGIQQAGSTMYGRGEMTPQESQQYSSSFDLGNLVQQLIKYQQGLGQAPAGYQTGEQQYQAQGPLAQSYYGQTLAGVQDPYAAYESQLQPSLKLTEDYINRGAQQRGLLRSGIPIEQMGRAGVELAIKEAQDRMNFRGQELARGGELSSYATGLGSSNIANLQNLYGAQQTAGIAAMNRQAGQAQQAAQYQAYPYQAQLGNYYGSMGNTGATMGTIGGGVVGAIPGLATGNPLLAMYGAGIGSTAGSKLGRAY